MSNPVHLNLNFYKGADSYSDGDIENDILSIVKRYSDFTDVLTKDNRWPVLYHLTPHRRNLLEWYEFKKNASLLEIGAGCGALTGLFCEKLDKVVAVELSKRRAEIICNRYKEKSNLDIIVGNLNDIKFAEKFDYITLIGVLEYAGKFTDSTNPYKDFLKQIKQYLKHDGVLIIAIENKFGLKYWAGAREDHSGRFFDGIENYLTTHGIKTFGKNELKKLLGSAGFNEAGFYYSMPDYKIPTSIYSDEISPLVGQINGFSPNYDTDRYQLFNEQIAYDNIILNDQFDFFANSFLVFCGNVNKSKIYSKFNRERLPEFQTETSIILRDNKRYAIKKALTSQAVEHVKHIHSNYLLLKYSYKSIKLTNSIIVDDSVEFDYIEGHKFDEILLDAILRKDKSEVILLIDKFIDIVKKSLPIKTGDYKSDNKFFSVFSQHVELKHIEYFEIANIDLVFSNLIINNDNQFTVIDYEWVFDFEIPVNYIIFRSIWDFALKYKVYLTDFMTKEELLNSSNISTVETVLYKKFEKNFHNYVFGENLDFGIKKDYLKKRTVLENLQSKKGSKIKAEFNRFKRRILNKINHQ